MVWSVPTYILHHLWHRTRWALHVDQFISTTNMTNESLLMTKLKQFQNEAYDFFIKGLTNWQIVLSLVDWRNI